jgi:hypothetical protein
VLSCAFISVLIEGGVGAGPFVLVQADPQIKRIRNGAKKNMCLISLASHFKRRHRTHAGKSEIQSIRGPKDPKDLPVKHS